ncbi:MAG TPA: hypothetical protein ENI17_01685 [Pseudomonas xinjiangensis]|uniref:Uncharacterized protein n=2 Tax=root TaxID=1 RepID=A0A7V1BP09_9GAMM|nr:hypothetical protein [Halopseudomonas xinjiangensis]HEC46328.1 hypothetical protein [Halopseudomonas xinjiangensis]
MSDVEITEIEQLMSGLDGKIAEGHAAQSRDAAYAVYVKLEALHEQLPPQSNVNRTLTEAGVEDALEQARKKAWRLYEAFHLEVQYDLEWASSRSYEDA